MLQGGNPYDTRRKSKENRYFLKKCCSVKIFWQYRYHLWTIIQIEDGSLRTQVPSGWKKWLLLWMESTNLTNYYTTCMAGKICPFPLYDQVVYLRIRARNDMKNLALWNSRSTPWRCFCRGRSCRRRKDSPMYPWTYIYHMLRMHSSSRKIRDRNNRRDWMHGLTPCCSPCTWHYLFLQGMVFISCLILFSVSPPVCVFHSCTLYWRMFHTSSCPS